MIMVVQTDAAMQVVAVLAAAGLVVASRHLPRLRATRSAGERRPARRARVVVAGAAVAGGAAMVVAMAAGPAPAADDSAGRGDGDAVGPDSRDEPGWLGADGPVPARPDPEQPQAFTSGS